MIPSRQPKISLTLKKVQLRGGADRVAFMNDITGIHSIDLKDFLGESGSVNTARGLDRTGIFSITLADKKFATKDGQFQDTVYALIEPMDIIEISMAQNPVVGDLPIVMRGVVSSVERSESMGGDGKPFRSVHISGYDFGKFLQIMQISYQKDYVYGNYVLSAFPLFESYGLWFNGTPEDFIKKVVGAINKFLIDMTFESGLEEILAFKIQTTVTGSRVGPFGMTDYEGTVMQLLTNWTDLGWNELFIEDRKDGVYLVYRPVPFYEPGSEELIMPDAVAPDSVDIQIEEVESLSLSRSDDNVANFYQVDAPQAEIVDLDLIKIWAMQNGFVLITDYRNCSPAIYGLKRMPMQTNQAIDGDYPRQMDMTKEEKVVASALTGFWFAQRTNELMKLNRDNVVFEDGSMTIKGREDIRAGMYVKLHRGGLISRYYVTHVSQQFMPYRLWKTVLQVTRGEGYIDRLGIDGSPYWSEGRKGVYE